MWVNNFNPHFMEAWQANMDIQFCMDSYAIITYITDYLTKGDAGLTKELRTALKETKNCNNFEQLNYLKLIYFKHKQVSVAEATYRLVKGLDLKKSNIACTFVTTGYPRNRSTFFMPAASTEKSTEENLDGDEQPIPESNKTPVTLEGKQGQFKEVDTIHVKYSQRPKSLDNVCLAQFATSYTYTRKDKIPKETKWEKPEKDSSSEKGSLKEFGSEEKLLPKYIQLFDSGTYMALRTKPFVLRIHSSKKKEYLEGIYSELLLYLPWRNENELMDDKEKDKEKKCVDLFNDNKKIIDENRKAILPNAPMIDSMMELLDAPDGIKPLHLADAIATDAEQANIDDQVEMEETNPLDTSDLPAEAGDKKTTRKPDGCPYKPIPVSTRDELIQKARSLSYNQRLVFDKMVTFAKSVVRAEKSKDPISVLPPPLLIVHGGGGVGKSYLIKTTSQWIDKILRDGTDRDNPDMPTVLLIAFTGVAAKNIGGTTFHTGLSFKFGSDMLEFSSEKLDSARKNLENVEVVIVDEFSMVSSDNLYNLHKRLQEIFMSQELFGGRSVLLVGDIMQLGPIRAAPIYREPKSIDSSAMFHSKELNLWSNCESVLLETNFRQGEGAWTQMLNRIRVGEPTDEDIQTLEGRLSTLLSKKEYNDAIHLFYTNIEVNGHNAYMLNSLEELLEEIAANLLTPKGYKAKTENGLIDKTQFAMNLKLKKSARVMIIANVNIKDSIVNGSMGTIIDFVKTDPDEDGKQDVRSIIVVFDDPETGLDQLATHKYDQEIRKHENQRGVPIFRSNLMYQVPYRKNNKEHGSMCQIKQFPLKLAWGSTGHKVQGITIKKGTNVVIHGHERIPDGMYYLMLSRAQEMEQVYIEMPTLKGKSEKLKLKIRANPHSLQENETLVKRSIVPFYKDNHFSIFMVNINSLQNKIIELTNDVHGQVSDHICVVETWLEANTDYSFNIPGRNFDHAPIGKGKGCGIFSLTTRHLPQPKQKVANEKYQLMSILDETNPILPYQIVLVYASSGCPFQNLVVDLEKLLHPEMTTIITGDFNFDKKENNALTIFLREKKFTQVVDWPTHKEGRTIDHCYVSKNTRVQLTRHSPYYSDHDGLCIEFEHFPWY